MTPRILWGAIYFSTFLFLVVLVVQPGPRPEPQPVMAYAFAVLGLGLAVVSFTLPVILRKNAFDKVRLEITEAADPNASGIIPYRDAPKRRVFADPTAAMGTAFAVYQTTLILGCALNEAIALFGFMLGFLGHPPQVFMPFFVLAWLLFPFRFPTLARVLEPLEKAKGAAFPS